MQAPKENIKSKGVSKMIENLAAFKAEVVNDHNLMKNQKQNTKPPKKLTAAQLLVIKDKLVKKNESLKAKQEKFEAQKQQKAKQEQGKAKPNPKLQTAPTVTNRPPVKPVSKNLKPVKTKEGKKIKLENHADTTKPKIIEKPVEVIKPEKPLTASKSKRSSQHSTIPKKDKDKLKQEMQAKIEKLSPAPRKLDDETVASVRRALSVLVDKALDTLQKVPREKLKAASINLQKKDVKLKPRTKSPLHGDPTAQLQAKVKENVMKEFEKVGSDIMKRSKNV